MLRAYERFLLSIDTRMNSAGKRFLSSPVQVAITFLTAHTAIWGFVMLLVGTLTAEDSMADAVATGGIVAAMITSAAAVTACASCWATIDDRRKFDLDTITYCRTITICLSTLRPALVLIFLSFLAARVHWLVLTFTALAAGGECLVVFLRPEWRHFDATTLYRYNRRAKQAALGGIFVLGALCVYCGGHFTAILLRASFSFIVRTGFRYAGRPGSVRDWVKGG
jgi:hypothetical protein